MSFCCSDDDCPNTDCNFQDQHAWDDYLEESELGYCVEEPESCPEAWECVNGNQCEGTAHLEYACDGSERHVCCEQPEPDAGIVDAGADCEDRGDGYECMGLVVAREGQCLGWIQYQISCSGQDVCCEIDPFYQGEPDGGPEPDSGPGPDAGPEPDSGPDLDGGSDSGTDAG